MKTILLIGAGHAHLEAIKTLSRRDIAKARFVLLSPDPESFYSGMIPRFVMGKIAATELAIAGFEYAKSKGCIVMQGSAVRADLDRRVVELADGRVLDFDVLSLDLGGRHSTNTIPCEAPNETAFVRPFADFLRRWSNIQKFIQVSAVSGACPVFAVIGGGPAAVEIATALKVRLNRSGIQKARVRIVSRGHRLCEGYSESTSNKIRLSLARIEVETLLNEDIQRIFEKFLILKDGSRLDFDFVFLLTPVEPPPFSFLPRDLSRNQDGFLLIDAKLRLQNHVFGVGDCVSSKTDLVLPKSGVTAVHQGRLLAESFRNLIDEREPPEFKPARTQLNILVSGEESARAVWGRVSIEGRAIMKLKNWIDRRYMNSFCP